MTDGETRFHLLAMCNTLREQLMQTEKLTSAVERLLSRDPELRTQYEAERRNANGSSAEPTAQKILLRLEQEIQALGGNRL